MNYLANVELHSKCVYRVAHSQGARSSLFTRGIKKGVRLSIRKAAQGYLLESVEFVERKLAERYRKGPPAKATHATDVRDMKIGQSMIFKQNIANVYTSAKKAGIKVSAAMQDDCTHLVTRKKA